ncbi:MAG: histidine phosphatase family protein [Ruminococcaceae bacterium]|nr:histidine phosphatase family protein [Oscillospiraceae bacterium]
MTTLLLIRHGFSTSNEDGTLTGQLDAPLTPLGVLQGEAASRYIYENYTVDAIYSSDLSRAVDTVRPLAELTKLPIFTDPDFREMNCGAWSGEVVASLIERYGDAYREWANASDSFVPEGGEAWSALARRALDALLRVAEAEKGKTVAVATHGGTIKALRGAYLGIPVEEWREKLPFAPNASVTVVTYEDGAFREERIVEEYLGALRTEMPKGI